MSVWNVVGSRRVWMNLNALISLSMLAFGVVNEADWAKYSGVLIALMNVVIAVLDIVKPDAVSNGNGATSPTSSTDVWP